MSTERIDHLIPKHVKSTFIQQYAREPLLVRSPGRINLIGEHTDYNNGFVLPAAVSQSIYFAAAESGDDDVCSLLALDLDERFDFKLTALKPMPPDSWQNYILGVAAEIIKSGRTLRGFNMVFSGNVPLGAGMSSSAALECGTGVALNELFGLHIPKMEMVKMAQQAEHNYAGVKCGVMDQFASMMGKKDQVLLLDCQDLTYRHFSFELGEYSLLLCNSNVSHSLASSEYNVRRQQCETGVAILKKKFQPIRSLRDAAVGQLNEVRDQMEEVIYRRCKYIIEENERVHLFIDALVNQDLAWAGQLLKTAQEAMRYEYEITCPEIDFLADFANSHPAIIGARMMGGGFGGCTLNIVKTTAKENFVSELVQEYKRKFSKQLTPIEVVISNGTEVIEI
ncbi:MAG: galactokinase [Saprospiraceae bacterium]|nr:galactokinase [Saprospiraceae bacterium]